MLDDVLHVLDVAYDVEASEENWLAALTATVDRAFEHGALAANRGNLGAFAVLYRITSDGRLTPLRTHTLDASPATSALLPAIPDNFPAWYVRATFGRFQCGTVSHAGSKKARALTRTEMAGTYRELRWRDVFGVNGLDPSDHGVWLGVPLKNVAVAPPEIVSCWSRVAIHLAAAWRLRRRMAATKLLARPEAVIDPRGVIAHVEGAATTKAARDALSDAVRALERVRAGTRCPAARALAQWKGLVDARWTLVDDFGGDGKRYFVAQRNEVETPDISRLTGRERQVVAFASLGHTNKVIAYELGISPYTVGVFLYRAARKLRVASRKELLAAFSAASPNV